MPRRSRKTPAERIRRDTIPDGVVAIPGDDDETIVRCGECGEVAIKGGPLVPDEEMVRRRWDVCAFGENWSWCHRERNFKQR